MRSYSPTRYLVGMFDPMFLTREILQPRPVTSYICWNCCSFPVRSCIPTLIPRRQVKSDVPYHWNPAAPPLYPVGMFDLVFPTREILQPHPDTSQACSIWCAETLRSCSPELIPPRNVRSSVQKPWDPSAPSWHLVGMFDLVFRTREILQPRSCSSICMFGLRSLPVRFCSSVCMCALMSQPVKSCSSCACSVLGPHPLEPAAPYTCLLWGPNPWNPV